MCLHIFTISKKFVAHIPQDMRLCRPLIAGITTAKLYHNPCNISTRISSVQRKSPAPELQPGEGIFYELLF